MRDKLNPKMLKDMNKKELKEIIKVYSFEVNWLKNKNKQLENENNKLKGYIDGIEKQLTLTDVVSRYDVNKYTPPFRVGRKQSKSVLDSKGLEVVFFMHSEEQAKMYCDYLNNVC